MDDGPLFPEPHVVLPTSTHTHTMILLHGRGSNGEDFAQEIFEGLSISEQSLPQHFPGFKWIFPNAHESFSTIFQQNLFEWFDVYSLTNPSIEEELQIDGLRESVAFIQGLVDDEVRIFGPAAHDRIILGGISQGCGVAITALLSGMCGIRAFVGFNGWMPLIGRVRKVISEATLQLNVLQRQRCEGLATALRASLELNEEATLHPPGDLLDDRPVEPESGHLHTLIHLSHTADDHVIDIASGKEMRETLVDLGMCNVDWKEYETGGHWITEPEGFEDLVEFLSEIVWVYEE